MLAKTKTKEKEKDVIDQLLDQIDFHGMTAEELAGENSLVKKLTSRFYSKALDAEMDEHLGYKENDNAGDNSGNSRNGYTSKTVITDDNDTIEVHVPRDIQHHLQQVYGVAINWEGRKEVLGLWLAVNQFAILFDGRVSGFFLLSRNGQNRLALTWFFARPISQRIKTERALLRR